MAMEFMFETVEDDNFNTYGFEKTSGTFIVAYVVQLLVPQDQPDLIKIRTEEGTLVAIPRFGKRCFRVWNDQRPYQD